jgi:hypothetical protein
LDKVVRSATTALEIAVAVGSTFERLEEFIVWITVAEDAATVAETEAAAEAAIDAALEIADEFESITIATAAASVDEDVISVDIYS